MFLRRVTSSAVALASSRRASVRMERRHYAPPVQDFIDSVRTQITNQVPAVGRAWKASELRGKSFDELHTLWFVLLKERNMLLSERERARKEQRTMERRDRLLKVQLSMSRLQTVLRERKLVHERLKEYQREHLLSPQAPSDAAAP